MKIVCMIRSTRSLIVHLLENLANGICEFKLLRSANCDLSRKAPRLVELTICPKTITLQHLISGQMILGAVTSRSHHRNCLGTFFGHCNSYGGFECDLCIVMSGDLGMWEK